MWTTNKGLYNAVKSIELLLSSQMPLHISTYNTGSSCMAYASLRGPYTFSSDCILIVSINGGDAISVTISAGTYTAQQLANILSGDVNFSSVLTPTTLMNKGHLAFYISSQGSQGSIKILGGTANSILGFNENRIFSFTPLTLPRAYLATFVEHFYLPAMFPLCTVSLDNSVFNPLGNMEMFEYSVRVRLYNVLQNQSVEDNLFTQLLEYGTIISNIISDTDFSYISANVNSCVVDSIDVAQSIGVLIPYIENDYDIVGSYVEIMLTVSVQEK